MLGPLRHLGFERGVGGAGRRERFLQRAAGTAAFEDQQACEQQDHRDAGKVDRQQDPPGAMGFRGSRHEQFFLLGRQPVEVGDNFRHQGAAFRPVPQGRYSRGVSRGQHAKHVVADRKPLGDQALGLLDELCLPGGIPGRLGQTSERRCDPGAGFVKFVQKTGVAVERKTAYRAFPSADQRPQIRDFLLYSQRVVDPGRIGPRLGVETDRSGGDHEKDGKACSESKALRGHC